MTRLISDSIHILRLTCTSLLLVLVTLSSAYAELEVKSDGGYKARFADSWTVASKHPRRTRLVQDSGAYLIIKVSDRRANANRSIALRSLMPWLSDKDPKIKTFNKIDWIVLRNRILDSSQKPTDQSELTAISANDQRIYSFNWGKISDDDWETQSVEYLKTLETVSFFKVEIAAAPPVKKPVPPPVTEKADKTAETPKAQPEKSEANPATESPSNPDTSTPTEGPTPNTAEPLKPVAPKQPVTPEPAKKPTEEESPKPEAPTTLPPVKTPEPGEPQLPNENEGELPEESELPDPADAEPEPLTPIEPEQPESMEPENNQPKADSPDPKGPSDNSNTSDAPEPPKTPGQTNPGPDTPQDTPGNGDDPIVADLINALSIRYGCQLVQRGSQYDKSLYSADHINDGKADSLWRSEAGANLPHTFVYALQDEAKIHGIQVTNVEIPETFPGISVKEVSVEVSTTGPTGPWTALKTIIANANGTTQIPVTGPAAQWVRIKFLSNHGHPTLSQTAEVELLTTSPLKPVKVNAQAGASNNSGTPNFTVDRLRFSEQPNGADAGHEFRPGAKLFLNFKPRGLKINRRGQYSLSADLLIYGANDKVIVTKLKFIDHVAQMPQAPLSPYVTIKFNIPDQFPVGRYQIEIVARDMLAGSSKSTKIPLIVGKTKSQ